MAVNYDYINKRNASKARQSSLSGIKKMGNRFHGNLDPNTSEGLYNLAMMQGGRSAEVIAELAHPQKSILSSIGERVKNFAGDVLDVLSTGNEAVAGVILSMQGNGLSLSENVRKAITEDISASDALLGEFNGKNKTGLQKVGNFVMRTGIDILLDPTTYITFGASQGIMGFKAASKFTAGKELASELGIQAGKKVALAEGVGDDLMKVVQKSLYGEFDDVYKSARTRLSNAGISDDVLNSKIDSAVGDALKLMDSKTIAPDAANFAMRNLMEIAPGLSETVLDKGGIKFFGKTILEGQKIKTAVNYLPLARTIDKATEPYRMAINSLFNPSIQGSIRKGFKYVPEEYIKFTKQLALAKKEKGAEFVSRLEKTFKDLGFKTYDEMNSVMLSFYNGVPAADEKLSSAYKAIYELQGDNYLAMRAAGKNTSYLANRIPYLISKNEVNQSFEQVFNFPLNDTITASKQKKNVVFDSVTGGQPIMGNEGTDFLQLNSDDAIKLLGDDTAVQEVLNRQLSILDDEIAKIEKYNPENKSGLLRAIKEQ